MKAIAIVLIVLGLGLTIFTSVKYFTREKVLEVGKLEVTADKPHYYSWSPFVGIALIGVGGIMLWQAGKKGD